MRFELPPKHYMDNGISIYSCQYLVVFTTRRRRPLLKGKILLQFQELFRKEAASYLRDGSTLPGLPPCMTIIQLEVSPDSVWVMVDCPSDIAIQQAINHIKRKVSAALIKEFPSMKLGSIWTKHVFVSTMGVVDSTEVDKYLKKFLRT